MINPALGTRHLSPNQEVFAQRLAAGDNPTTAYLAMATETGREVQKNSAQAASSVWNRDPRIVARVAELRRERAQAAPEAPVIDTVESVHAALAEVTDSLNESIEIGVIAGLDAHEIDRCRKALGRHIGRLTHRAVAVSGDQDRKVRAVDTADALGDVAARAEAVMCHCDENDT